MRVEIVGDLQEVIDSQNRAIEGQNESIKTQNRAIEGLGDLVTSMDKTVKAFASLLDAHQAVLRKNGLMPKDGSESSPFLVN